MLRIDEHDELVARKALDVIEIIRKVVHAHAGFHHALELAKRNAVYLLVAVLDAQVQQDGIAANAGQLLDDGVGLLHDIFLR